MNAKLISLFSIVLAAAGAQAATPDEYTLNLNLPTAAVSTTPRVATKVAAVDEFQRNLTPAATQPSGVQRAQITAEAIEARKLGLVSEGERLAPTPSAAQAEQIHQAGLQAVQNHVAAR